MDNNITALHQYVVLKEIVEDEAKSEGGILLERVQEASIRATVIACGSKVESVKVNDTVLFNRPMTTTAVIGGEDYLLIKEIDIFVII